MFSENQTAILRVLAAAPGQQMSMSDIGRVIGKKPGVFQRGLNSLETQEYVLSHRSGNMRLFKFNMNHPLRKEIMSFVISSYPSFAGDFSLKFPADKDKGPLAVAEPHEAYEASPLKALIIAGPNGAGKTTFASQFLKNEQTFQQFINADNIAMGLSPFNPSGAALKAGRLMISETNNHVKARKNFAVETTLSGTRYRRVIKQWQKDGYRVKLIFLSLKSLEVAVARVAARVMQGGHDIPEATIKRRYDNGLKNFNSIYKSLVDAWAVYDNSSPEPILLEEGE